MAHNLGSTITIDVNNVKCYYALVIKTFKDKETQKVFNRCFSKRLPQSIQQKTRKKLVMLDAATDLNVLRIPPGNRLEELKDDRKGQYSIRINDQYRICFEWHGDDAYNVEVVDYH